MPFRLSGTWRRAVVAVVLVGIPALTVWAYRGDSLVFGVYTLLGRRPVLAIANQSGEDVWELVADFSGGSAQWDRLEDGESITLSLWLRGESSLTISWRDADGRLFEWNLGCYLENTWYDKIGATILPAGKIEATTLMSGKLGPAPVVPETNTRDTREQLEVPAEN